MDIPNSSSNPRPKNDDFLNVDGDKQGYLIKQGHVRKNWKRRWFVLRNSYLYYFPSPQEMIRSLGCIPLAGSTVEELTNSAFAGKTEYCFLLTPSPRSSAEENTKYFYLCAETNVEMQDWIGFIKSASANIGPSSRQHKKTNSVSWLIVLGFRFYINCSKKVFHASQYVKYGTPEEENFTEDSYKNLDTSWKVLLKTNGFTETEIKEAATSPEKEASIINNLLPKKKKVLNFLNYSSDSIKYSRDKELHKQEESQPSGSPIFFTGVSREEKSDNSEENSKRKRTFVTPTSSTSNIELKDLINFTDPLERYYDPIVQIVLNIDTETRKPNIYSQYFCKKKGSGAFGSVHISSDKKSGQKVAIKKLSTQTNKEKYIVAELGLLKTSQHPNIVSYIDSYAKVFLDSESLINYIFNSDGDIWVVMECMAGSLADVIDTGYLLNESEIAYFCKETLHALSYMHNLNRLHRDIKSNNVLISENGNVKLTDFGFCVQLEKGNQQRRTVLGTPNWMPPEISSRTPYDLKVDIWSLGITCYEMAEGLPPYFDVDNKEVGHMVQNYGVPPLKEASKWSKYFKNFVSLCTQLDPKNRPNTGQLLDHPFIALACTNREIDSILELLVEKHKHCTIL